MDLDGVFEDGEAELMRDLEGSTAEDVTMRTRLLENEIRVLRDESNRLALDLQSDKERVKENMEKIKMNKQLPYLVGNVVEILDLKPEVRRFGSRQKVPRSSARGQAPRGRIVRSGRAPKEGRSGPHGPHAELADPQACALQPHLPPTPRTQEEEEEEDGGNVDLDSRRQGKAVVLKTTTRQTIFLPVIGLVDGGTFLVHALHLLFFSSSRLRAPQGSATISPDCL
jgi:ATP-dependent 26S proteasome regulatory subunit